MVGHVIKLSLEVEFDCGGSRFQVELHCGG